MSEQSVLSFSFSRFLNELRVKMKKLIAGALIGCASIVLVAWAISRNVNNKQDAEWCHENGYTNYATKDGFCVGAGGKLIKVGRQ
jgi:DhnA family fructose-bisphosphate aldolase class Ia